MGPLLSSKFVRPVTGKSLSEAFIFALTNPQYDDRLFIWLQVQHMKIPSSNLGIACCAQKLFLTFRTIFVHNMFSPCSSKRRAPVPEIVWIFRPHLKAFGCIVGYTRRAPGGLSISFVIQLKLQYSSHAHKMWLPPSFIRSVASQQDPVSSCAS